MTGRVVERSDWTAFANHLYHQLKGAQVEIEVAALNVGDQIQAEWVPLLGLAYDSKSDAFEVVVDGLDHVVRRPTTVVVQQEGALVHSLAIEAEGGARHVLKFRELLSLPAPE